jgi:hypothetical protein
MRRILLILTLVILGIGIVFLAWLALGSRISESPPSLPPSATTAPAPTLTTAQRADLITMRERALSMAKAARDLRALGQAIRGDAAWKSQVRTSVSVITGGQKVIGAIDLPIFLRPLRERTEVTTKNCAAIVTTFPGVDTLTPAVVSAHDGDLERCATELDRLILSIDSL